MGELNKPDLCGTGPRSNSFATTSIRTLVMTVFALIMVNTQAQQVTWSLKGAWPGLGPEWRMSCVQVVSNRAFVTSASWSSTNLGNLAVFDLTNPTNPVPMGFYETVLQIGAVRVAGNYAFLAEGTWRNGTNDPGSLVILDVGNPTNLLHVASVTNLGVAHHLEVVGNYAYVTERERWTGSNSLGALSIFDVSNPSNPVRVGQYATNGHFYDLHVSGHYAYVAGGNADLLVFDVSNPTAPALLGNYSTNTYNEHTGEPGGPAEDIDVVGPYVTSAGPDGLHVIDVSNPSAPIRVGGWMPETLFTARIVGSYLFAGRNVNYPQGPVLSYWRIYDVSNPPAITLLGNEVRDTRWAVDDIVIADPYVYIASGTNGLLVFKIEQAEAPPSISVARQDDVLILTWRGAPGLSLQWTSELLDPAEWPEWIDVPGSEGQSRIELPMSRERAFFRLIRPWL